MTPATSQDERPLSVAFVAIAELAITLEAPLKDVAVWTHQVDDAWWLALNPHQQVAPVTVTARGHGEPAATTTVAAYSALVFFNGWPFGVLDPFGGSLMRGAAANEDSLIAALRAAIARASAGGAA